MGHPLLSRIFLEQVGKLLAESFDFGPVADQYVGIVGIVQSVVLMVGLSVVETLQGHDLGDDRFMKHAGCVELRDIFGGDLPLGVV